MAKYNEIIIDIKSFWVRYEQLCQQSMIRDNFKSRVDFLKYYNINYSTYCNAKNKGNMLSADLCVRSANAFNVSIDYLIKGKDTYTHESLLTDEQKAVVHDPVIREVVQALMENPTIKTPTLSFVKTISSINEDQENKIKNLG